MNPGRELDALIAEKVFGLKTENYGYFLVERVDPSNIKGIYPIDYLIPEYSTSIGAAWEVVDKLQDYSFILQTLDRTWQARFGVHWGRSDTAPHAVCLAALKAVGASCKSYDKNMELE